MPSEAVRADTATLQSSPFPCLARRRLEIPGVLLHVSQGAINLCAIFLDDEDRQHDLRRLGKSAASHDLGIHLHLIVTANGRLQPAIAFFCVAA